MVRSDMPQLGTFFNTEVCSSVTKSGFRLRLEKQSRMLEISGCLSPSIFWRWRAMVACCWSGMISGRAEMTSTCWYLEGGGIHDLHHLVCQPISTDNLV